MKRLTLFILLAAISPLACRAQAPQPHPELTFVPGNRSWIYAWQGVAGRTYFLQHSDDMIHWSYFPLIESGAGQLISYGFSSTATRFFVSLRYSDQTTSDPEGDDFDGDGLSNWDEVSTYGTDPLLADTDNDGASDGMEILLGRTPLKGVISIPDPVGLLIVTPAQ